MRTQVKLAKELTFRFIREEYVWKSVLNLILVQFCIRVCDLDYLLYKLEVDGATL